MQLRSVRLDGSGSGSAVPVDLDSEQTLVLVFGAASLLDSPGPVVDLVSAFPRSKVLGCSTAGEIFGAKVGDDSLVVAVARFAATTLATASAPISAAEQSHAAGEAIGRALARPDLKGVHVLSDGLVVNGSELVRGLVEVLPSGVVVTGGLAGDGDRFARTWVLHAGAPASGHVTAVGFYGDRVQIGHGSAGGWDPFGPRRLVTRSKGNILYELDGKPALELYKQYLGDRAQGLPATGLLFPLALSREGADGEDRLVRTILAVDEATQSLTFAGDIPTGAHAQLMKAQLDRLVEGAEQAAAHARLAGGDEQEDQLAIAISCVGRRLVLRERSEEEVEAIREALGASAQVVGFYSYGELSPSASGACDLHNQTMTLTTIRER
ncbi:MAG TPA: FIST N-terminal domain-containing protein [Nannocystis sp.]